MRNDDVIVVGTGIIGNFTAFYSPATSSLIIDRSGLAARAS
jgi:hypothetical protein